VGANQLYHLASLASRADDVSLAEEGAAMHRRMVEELEAVAAALRAHLERRGQPENGIKGGEHPP
jgi:hypothetical protein